ncbi:MAG: monovalent cation/H+ antiporter complex subunit F [Acidimicrobiales bacterium]|jgi:multicomponent Na+:H+ antiporter subunit F|nr:monovalent cation/H+ antiporter complex subunit F [Acidimicrobiales bacterium]
MSAVAGVALGALALGAALTFVRLLRGPTLADRIVASDLLLTFLVTGAAVDAARTGAGTYLEPMLVVAVLGFLGTSVLARFLEGRGP